MKWCNPGELCQFISISETFDITDFSKNLHCCDDIDLGSTDLADGEDCYENHSGRKDK